MELLGIFTQVFVVSLSGALMPGPLLTYNIQSTYTKGFWVGPKLVLGHAILEVLLILGIIGGLKSFIELTGTRIVVGAIGGILLIWMSYGLIRTKSNSITSQATLSANETKSFGFNLSPVFAGIVISISNPYFLLWWVSIGLALMTQSLALGWIGILIFFISHIAADLGWYSLVSAAIFGGRQFISERFYRRLLMVCGLFLLVLAFRFLYDALVLAGTIQWFQNRVIDLFKHYQYLV